MGIGITEEYRWERELEWELTNGNGNEEFILAQLNSTSLPVNEVRNTTSFRALAELLILFIAC
jgi:hypothetical protein